VFPEVPSEYYETPIGQPNVVRTGHDLSILTVGAALYRALEAATQLDQQYGISAEVIDARSLVPFDYTEVLASVAKTGRLVCVSDANLRGSWLNTVAAKVNAEAFDDLDGPVVVLGARNWIAPPAEMEWEFFVTPEDILDAIHTRVLPLPEHRIQEGPGAEGTLEESRMGI
jgi:2-oxoisovalerate dehydrogenase E1 component